MIQSQELQDFQSNQFSEFRSKSNLQNLNLYQIFKARKIKIQQPSQSSQTLDASLPKIDLRSLEEQKLITIQANTFQNNYKWIVITLFFLIVILIFLLMFFVVKTIEVISTHEYNYQVVFNKNEQFQIQFYNQTQLMMNYNPTYNQLNISNNYTDSLITTQNNSQGEKILNLAIFSSAILDNGILNISSMQQFTLQNNFTNQIDNAQAIYRKSNQRNYILHTYVNKNGQKTLILTTTDQQLNNQTVSFPIHHEKNLITPVNIRNYEQDMGVMLFRDEIEKLPLIFWCNNKIYTSQATTMNGVVFKNLGVFIQARMDKFDSNMVQIGPNPVQLSDGNYLFIYNSARQIKKQQLEYNVGYVISDKDDPKKVIQRSDKPLLSAKNCTNYLDKQLNQKIFVSGIKQINPDNFIIFYSCFDQGIENGNIQIYKFANIK